MNTPDAQRAENTVEENALIEGAEPADVTSPPQDASVYDPDEADEDTQVDAITE